MADKLEFGGIHIDHPTAIQKKQGIKSRVYLIGYTPKGQPREISLTHRQLIQLVADGARFIATILGVRTRG